VNTTHTHTHTQTFCNLLGEQDKTPHASTPEKQEHEHGRVSPIEASSWETPNKLDSRFKFYTVKMPRNDVFQA